MEMHMALSEQTVESKPAEKAAATGPEGWRAVFETAIGAVLTDLSGRFVAANPAYQTAVGYAEEELRGISFLDLSHEDYRESHRALIQELSAGKRQPIQTDYRLKCSFGF